MAWVKLSELRGQAVLDFPTAVMESIERIAQDDEAADIFNYHPVPDGMTAQEYAMRRLNSARVALLGKHNRDVAIIMAADVGLPLDEYLEQIDVSTYGEDVYQMMVDPTMRSFFSSARLTLTSSSSVQTNTEGV